jgi:hypothetical protein
MYSGGIADKIGNRFEARWLTLELLGLLSGKAASVTIEKIGDDEQGFEFLVEQADVSVWHQCKRQTSAVSWTINALAAEGIIANFSGKLGITSANRCVFVSTDVAKQIKLLEEKRRISTSLKEFEDALAQSEITYWQNLKDHLAVDGEGALDWLAHCEFHTVSEDMLELMVAHRVAFWFDGHPDVIVSAIRAWVEEDATINRPIDRAAFLQFAANKRFTVKQYELDRTIPGRLEDRTRSYVDSYSPLGAGLFQIDRCESGLLVETLLEAPDVDVVALVGPAGSGKSAIVRAAVARIAEKGMLQLAFRVDQVGEPLSIAQLGIAVIDVDDSPAVVLEKLSGNDRAILYIDQADAVSEMAGRSTQVRRQVLDLVKQARSYEHVRLVFSCRTFDFENDAQFLEIAKSSRTVRIDVPMYDWDRDVVPVLVKLQISIEDSPRIRALLAQAIALSLAAKLAQNGGADLRDVDTLSGLFERLIEGRDRAIRQRYAPPWSLYQVLEAVAAEMSERQELVASARVLDCFAGSKDYLQQEGLIVVANGRISLIHESLFDHLHARSFVSGSQSLVEFLGAGEQTLFRRTQVRQILAAERDLRPNRYRSDLRGLLMADAVRAHIKDFVLRWLGTIANPSGEEWRILALYSAGRGDDDFPGSVGIVLFGQPGWLDLLSELGLVAVWLAGGDASQAWALNLVRSSARTGSTRLIAELDRYLDERPDQAGRLLEHLHYVGPGGPQANLADVIIRALSMIDDVEALKHGEGLFELNSSWVDHAPKDAARILSAFSWSLTADSVEPQRS